MKVTSLIVVKTSKHFLSKLDSKIYEFNNKSKFWDNFKSFNIIDVKAASDLSSAKVYFSIINGDESDVPEIKFLEKFSSMIRSQVASEVVLKKVPKLKFIYDNTLYEANSIDDLLKSLNE